MVYYRWRSKASVKKLLEQYDWDGNIPIRKQRYPVFSDGVYSYVVFAKGKVCENVVLIKEYESAHKIPNLFEVFAALVSKLDFRMIIFAAERRLGNRYGLFVKLLGGEKKKIEGKYHYCIDVEKAKIKIAKSPVLFEKMGKKLKLEPMFKERVRGKMGPINKKFFEILNEFKSLNKFESLNKINNTSFAKKKSRKDSESVHNAAVACYERCRSMIKEVETKYGVSLSSQQLEEKILSALKKRNTLEEIVDEFSELLIRYIDYAKESLEYEKEDIKKKIEEMNTDIENAEMSAYQKKVKLNREISVLDAFVMNH